MHLSFLELIFIYFFIFLTHRPIGTFNEVVDEIYTRVEYVEPWAAGASRAPSSAFCLLFKLGCLRLTTKQLMMLINHRDSPYIRAIGFLYIRYTIEPKQHWGWFRDYTEDPEEFSPSSGFNAPTTTMGEFVLRLIKDQNYYSTQLPRIPVPVQRDLDVKVAMVAEDKLRDKFHRKHMHLFAPKARAKARYSEDEEWYDATLVEPVSDAQDRWIVKYDEYDETEERSIGQLDLLDPKYSFKENHEGKGLSAREMAQKLREREKEKVTTGGRDFAHRPASLKGALSMKLNNNPQRKGGERSVLDELAQVSGPSTTQQSSTDNPQPKRKKKRGLRLDDDGPIEDNKGTGKDLRILSGNLGRDHHTSTTGNNRRGGFRHTERRDNERGRPSHRDQRRSPSKERRPKDNERRSSRGRSGSRSRHGDRRDDLGERRSHHRRSRSPRRRSRDRSRHRRSLERKDRDKERRRSSHKRRSRSRSRSRSRKDKRRRHSRSSSCSRSRDDSLEKRKRRSRSPDKHRSKSPSSGSELSLSSGSSDGEKAENVRKDAVKAKYQSVTSLHGEKSENFADKSLVDEDIVTIGS